jgi:hypothetical protein
MSVTNPLDQPQLLEVQIKDNNPFSETYGQLVDPGGLELIVQPAGGEPTTYTYADAEIVKASTGVYYYIVPADVSGQWSYRWIATGEYAGATNQMFFPVQSSTIG